MTPRVALSLVLLLPALLFACSDDGGGTGDPIETGDDTAAVTGDRTGGGGGEVTPPGADSDGQPQPDAGVGGGGGDDQPDAASDPDVGPDQPDEPDAEPPVEDAAATPDAQPDPEDITGDQPDAIVDPADVPVTPEDAPIIPEDVPIGPDDAGEPLLDVPLVEDTMDPVDTWPDVVGPDPDVPGADDLPLVEDAQADVEDDAGEPVDPPPWDCDNVSKAPIPFETHYGFTTSEDFDFDTVGNVVSIGSGGVVKQTKDAHTSFFVPLTGFIAGMSYLPNGDLIVAHAGQGCLIRVTPEGAKITVLCGFQYPNGLDVDKEGFVYVAEQDAERLRRVDPMTGEFWVMGEDICNANGVSFGPGYDRIYVGSFGCGVIYALDRIHEHEWGQPYVFGDVGEAYEQPVEVDPTLPKWCDGMAQGDPCYEDAIGAGTCQPGDDGALDCVGDDVTPVPLVAACDGASNGDACTVPAAGKVFPGFCGNGFGFPGMECNIDDDPACDDLSQGDKCLKATYGYLYWGTCSAAGAGLRCNGEPGGGGGGGGGGDGLDGLNVDACGNVYVTEYIAGIVWRFPPDASYVENVAELPSSWIPNMHWGSGVGGWDAEVLYVSDRDQGRLFGLQIGVPGKEHTAP